MKRRLSSLALTLAMILTLPGCSTQKAAVQAENLMTGISPSQTVSEPVVSTGPSDFAVRLFQHSAKDGENTLVSPLSVLSALAMTANGARGDTLTQMEGVLGMSVGELNKYMAAYRAALPNSETCKLHVANSIWFRDDPSFSVEQPFLQTNADFYGAGVYKSPFDNTTLSDINNWVKENTDGMIPSILDDIAPDAVMYLVNALAFDAEWMKVYNEHNIYTDSFTQEDGTVQEAELMRSKERYYLRDEQAQGFLKLYDNTRYAFAALLPDEGVRVADYVSTLTGEEVETMLKNPSSVTVKAAIPKFELEYSADMRTILTEMGMPDAFSGALANLTGLGHSDLGNIYISRVLHKTYICVDEKGTKAGASTAVEAVPESAQPEPEEPKTVILDRPFVYMIVDWETSLPIFIGTVMEL